MHWLHYLRKQMANLKLGALGALLKSKLAGLGADVERGAIVTPKFSTERTGTLDGLDWDKGIKSGLFSKLDKLGLTPDEMAQSGNMHTHVPFNEDSYSDHWLAAAPSEGDYAFANRFLRGQGENYVLHPTSGVVEKYGVPAEGTKALIDIARAIDPAFGYTGNDVGYAVHNLVAPGVSNPKFEGMLPPQFRNSAELSRRLNQMLLKEHGAVSLENDGPKIDNDLMLELLQKYRKQKRKFAKGGLTQYKDAV